MLLRVFKFSQSKIKMRPEENPYAWRHLLYFDEQGDRRWTREKKNKTKKIYVKKNLCNISGLKNKPSSVAKREMKIKLKVRYK